MFATSVTAHQLISFFQFYTDVIPSTLEEISGMTGVELAEIERIYEIYSGYGREEMLCGALDSYVPYKLTFYIEITSQVADPIGMNKPTSWQELKGLSAMGYDIADLFRSGDLKLMKKGVALLTESRKQVFK